METKNTHYRIITCTHKSVNLDFYWILKVQAPTWYRCWTKVTTIPKYECPYSGQIPFFNIEEARYVLDKLREGNNNKNIKRWN